MNVEQHSSETDGYRDKGPSSITATKRHEQEELQRHIDEFISSGGRIVIVEGPTVRSLKEVSHISKKIATNGSAKKSRQFGQYK